MRAIALLLLLASCSQPPGDDNSKLARNSSGSPMNCRALISDVTSDVRKGRADAAWGIDVIEKHCGPDGDYWKNNRP